MDYAEIILKNIKNIQIEDVFYDCVHFDIKDIISSHFFDNKKNKDMTYQEIKSLKEYFYRSNTCSFYLKKAIIGAELENILIHIGCNEKYGDITINFEEKQFIKYKNEEIKDKLQRLLIWLQRIYRDNNIKEIILGYEPADDADMKILAINQKQTEIFNENIIKSLLANAIYSIAKKLSI